MLMIQTAVDLLNPLLPIRHRALLQQRWQEIVGDTSLEPIQEGCLVYLPPEEIDHPLTDIGFNRALGHLVFEGIRYYPDADCYEMICVSNNSFAWSFFVPHSPEVNPERLPWLAALLEGV